MTSIRLKHGGAIVAAAILGITLVMAGWIAVHGLRLHGELTAALAAASTPGEQMQTLAATTAHARAARAEVHTLRPIANPLATIGEWLAPVPAVGPQAGQAAALWRFVEAATTLGGELLDALDQHNLSADAVAPLDVATQAIPTLVDRFPEIRAQFERAQQARDALGEPTWPFATLAPRLAIWDRTAPLVARVLPLADQIAPGIPTLGGWIRPVTYLVLIQTRDELRATGGFITSVGTVKIERGRPVAISIQKVYEAERATLTGPWQPSPGVFVVPPAPLQRFMGLKTWHLRDANWAADFPSSARQAARFWELLTGTQVDGVIAFDERFLDLLLRATGPIVVPEYGAVDASNFRSTVLAQVFQGDDAARWHAAQTTLSQAFATAMVQRIQHLPSERLFAVADVMHEALRTRALLVSAFEPVAAGGLHDGLLDGGLRGEVDDYLYVVESNVGYTKLSPFIKQRVAYAVQLGPDARPVAAAVTIEAQNTFRPELADPGYPPVYYLGSRWNEGTYGMDSWSGYYGGYTRILVPGGSRPVRTEGFDDGPFVGTEGGRVAVGGYCGLHIGATRSIFLETVPSIRQAVAGRYRLVVQRQPGAAPRELSVRVRLPPGTKSTSLSPPPDAVDGDVLVWQHVVDADVVIEILLEQVGPIDMATSAEAVAPPLGPRTPTVIPQPTPYSSRGGFQAAYEIDVPTSWAVGTTATYGVTVHNHGPRPWPTKDSSPVRLGVYFGGPSNVPPGVTLGGIPSPMPLPDVEQRFDLPTDVPPGGSATLTITVRPPPRPGEYVLRHRMLMEYVAWFGQFVRTDVVVR